MFPFYIAFFALLFYLFQLSVAFFFNLYSGYAFDCQEILSWWTVLSLIRILPMDSNVSIKPLRQPVLIPLEKNSWLIALLLLSAFIAYLYCCFCFDTRTISNFILTISNYRIKIQHYSGQENKSLDRNSSSFSILRLLSVFKSCQQLSALTEELLLYIFIGFILFWLKEKPSEQLNKADKVWELISRMILGIQQSTTWFGW